MRLTTPCGVLVWRVLLDVSKDVLSVRREELEPELMPRGTARGRLEAVPGTPVVGEGAEPRTSSAFWDITITDFVGSSNSSLCSLVEKSQSAETPTRKCPSPSNGSRVDSTFATRSFS